jgi:hypothetical protein
MGSVPSTPTDGKRRSRPAHDRQWCGLDIDGKLLCPGCRAEHEHEPELTQELRDTETQELRDSTPFDEDESLRPSAPLCAPLCQPPTQPAAETEFFMAAMERVATTSPPPAAADFLIPGVQRLVHITAVLQQAAGDRPFYLDVRTAGRLLGVTHTTAWQWLHLLCRRGVLKCVSTGSKATRRANEYRFVADQGGQDR